MSGLKSEMKSLVLQICQKSRRIGCVIPRCNLQHGITQPIIRLYWKIFISRYDCRDYVTDNTKSIIWITFRRTVMGYIPRKGYASCKYRGQFSESVFRAKIAVGLIKFSRHSPRDVLLHHADAKKFIWNANCVFIFWKWEQKFPLSFQRAPIKCGGWTAPHSAEASMCDIAVAAWGSGRRCCNREGGISPHRMKSIL